MLLGPGLSARGSRTRAEEAHVLMVDHVGGHVHSSQCYTASRTSLGAAPVYDQRCRVSHGNRGRLNVMNMNSKPLACLMPNGETFELGGYP